MPGEQTPRRLQLPTDDVLILRDKKGDQVSSRAAPSAAIAAPGKAAATLTVIEGPPSFSALSSAPEGGVALVLSALDDVRSVSERVGDLAPIVRAIIASAVHCAAVTAFASEGIAVFAVPAAELEGLKGQRSIGLPAPSAWGNEVALTVGERTINAAWLAIGAERAWTHAGTSRTPTKAPR